MKGSSASPVAEPQEYFVMRSQRENTPSLGCANLVKTLRLEGTEMADTLKPSRRLTSRGLDISLELEGIDGPGLLRFIAEAIAYLENRIENIDNYPRERFSFFDAD